MTPDTSPESPYNDEHEIPHSPLIGLRFDRLTHHELVEWIGMSLLSRNCNTILFADAVALDYAAGNSAFRVALGQADLLLPGDHGMRLAPEMPNSSNTPEVAIDVLYDELLMELSHRQVSVYLLTENDAQTAAMKTQLQTRYPGLNFTGTSPPNLDTHKLSLHVDAINNSGAQVLLTMLTTPQQEFLLNKCHRQLKARLAIGLSEHITHALTTDSAPAFGINAAWKACKRYQRAALYRPRRTLSHLYHTLFDFFSKSTASGNTSGKTKTESINPVLTRSAWMQRWWRIRISLRASLWVLYCKSQRSLKRLVDVLGAGGGLLCLSPLLLLVISLVKFTSPGPIFYSQIRVGHRGKTFRMWKFRSMYIDADARKAALMEENEVTGGVIFKMKKDPRITPVGRVIRRLSIDELPQLFNVVTGDMSLVGPRPALESEVVLYPVLARARVEAMPGLTGLWQISGRSDLPFDKQILLDTTYVHTQSTGNDLKLIAKTIPAVISGKGAY
ncbi:MAG: sugar transferase [Pontibacterium sp.]